MKYLLMMIIFISLVGCDVQSEINAINSMRDKEQVWVFAQFNVREETDGLESYYYYAQISKKLYEAVSFNEIDTGFILLSNVKYWGRNDLIYDYKDVENSGDIIFRIKDIAKINLVNFEPIVGKGVEQFEEPDSQSSEQVQADSVESTPQRIHQ